MDDSVSQLLERLQAYFADLRRPTSVPFPTSLQAPKTTKRVRGEYHNREEAADVVHTVFRNMQAGTKPKPVGKGRSEMGGAEETAGRPGRLAKDRTTGDGVIRCPCGNSADIGMMIQCDGECGVWQHVSCVLAPLKPAEEAHLDLPSTFFCELCRISQGDPFSVTEANPLQPLKLRIMPAKADGSTPLQSVERGFVLSRAQRDQLHHASWDLQVWCALLNDPVPLRMHWPAYADLQLNGMPVRVTSRPGQQLLGINGRDEGPSVTAVTREGTNRLSMSAYDARPFCIGVRIIRRLSFEQVLDQIPREEDGEHLLSALARIRRCLGMGPSENGNGDGSDSDVEVVTDKVVVSLRCPMSGSRIKVAARFRPCLHLGCFDLHTLVSINQRARKWQCPICLHNYSLQHLIIDPCFNRITTLMKHYPEEVTDIEMKADGSWRPLIEGPSGSQEKWRSLDGGIDHDTLSQQQPLENGYGASHRVSGANVKVEQQELQQPLRLGLRRSSDGSWAAITSALNGSHVSRGNSAVEVTPYEMDEVERYPPTIDGGNAEPIGTGADSSLILLSDSDEEAMDVLASDQARRKEHADREQESSSNWDQRDSYEATHAAHGTTTDNHVTPPNDWLDVAESHEQQLNSTQNKHAQDFWYANYEATLPDSSAPGSSEHSYDEDIQQQLEPPQEALESTEGGQSCCEVPCYLCKANVQAMILDAWMHTATPLGVVICQLYG
eukprot:SM000120S25721  [mRNA]  locus=s120:346263:352049:- [translate_table: standard]